MNPLQFLNPAACPLCGEPNECQLCSPATYKGQCWCAHVEVPAGLLARVPEALRNRACICQNCVTTFHQQAARKPHAATSGDFYFDDAGRMVFTAAYHRRRGFCCGSGCRHCPYPKKGLPVFFA